jgi:hypothetical protein
MPVAVNAPARMTDMKVSVTGSIGVQATGASVDIAD